MCGIVGFVDRRHTPDPALLRRMTATLQHRGPDGFGVRVEGAAALGHSRLAIIDLSSGDQPMADPSGRWWLATTSFRRLRSASLVMRRETPMRLMVGMYTTYRPGIVR